MLAYLLRRLKGSTLARGPLLATTDRPLDDALEALARAEQVPTFRGSTDDVVARFVGAARAFPCEFVVRVTADCPFLDAATLDHCLTQCELPGTFDIASTKTRFPVGIDIEVYRASSMKRLHIDNELDAEEREHLTLAMYRRPDRFILRPLQPPAHWPSTRASFTVDTESDYLAASKWADQLGSTTSGVEELLALTVQDRPGSR
jgi:spore coat polysaccharide biosynthesis protein SpsF